MNGDLRDRLTKIKALRHAIADDLEAALSAIRADVGKPTLDALGGDILFPLEQLRWYEKNAERILAPRKIPGSSFGFAHCAFQETLAPLGTVLVIAPWNYPLQLALVPALSAWLAGNRVILKPSESAPATANYLERLLASVGIGRDGIRVVLGGPEQARALIEARPDKIFFTGSMRNGREVAKQAFSHGIPIDLELGGKDAMLVLEDANLARAAAAAAYGAFTNAGQVCVGIKRVWVARAVYAPFMVRLREEVAALRVGPAEDDDVAPLAREQEAELLERQVAAALADGANLETALQRRGRTWAPLVLSGVADSADLARYETFGPVLIADPFETEDEVVARVNAGVFGLSASVWSEDLARARRLAERLVVGSCAVNDVIRQIANPAAPFGGEKASGHGRYHGEDGLRTFCRRAVVMVNRSKSTREIHWFPTRKKTILQLTALIRLRHGGGRAWRHLKSLMIPAEQGAGS